MEAENAQRQFVINEQSDILNMRKAQRSDFYEALSCKKRIQVSGINLYHIY